MIDVIVHGENESNGDSSNDQSNCAVLVTHIPRTVLLGVFCATRASVFPSHRHQNKQRQNNLGNSFRYPAPLRKSSSKQHTMHRAMLIQPRVAACLNPSKSFHTSLACLLMNVTFNFQLLTQTTNSQHMTSFPEVNSSYSCADPEGENKVPQLLVTGLRTPSVPVALVTSSMVECMGVLRIQTHWHGSHLLYRSTGNVPGFLRY